MLKNYLPDDDDDGCKLIHFVFSHSSFLTSEVAT